MYVIRHIWPTCVFGYQETHLATLAKCCDQDESKIAVYRVLVTGTLAMWLGYRQQEIFTIHIILREKIPKKCNHKSSPNLNPNSDAKSKLTLTLTLTLKVTLTLTLISTT